MTSEAQFHEMRSRRAWHEALMRESRRRMFPSLSYFTPWLKAMQCAGFIKKTRFDYE